MLRTKCRLARCFTARRTRLCLLFVLAYFFSEPALAVTDPAIRCVLAKRKAAAMKTAGKVKCVAEAAARGLVTDPECLANAESRFASAFTTAEAAGGCLTVGDEPSVEDLVDGCVVNVRSALASTDEPPADSVCAAIKLKAAGKGLRAELKCHDRSLRKTAPVDATCIAKAESKLAVICSKADHRADCVQTGDAAAAQAAVADCLNAILGALPSPPPTATSSPTATPTATLTPGPQCGDPEPTVFAGVTAAHNTTRANAVPVPDPPLPSLCWSAAVATTAQAWADTCQATHNPNLGTLGLGENLFFFAPPGAYTPLDGVAYWAAESSDYDYATNTCAPGQVCGHYTQMVWRSTSHIGCGIATCNINSPFPGFTTWTWIVCDYQPPGNYVGQRPY
jgi:pathogenesis-related protein 1